MNKLLRRLLLIEILVLYIPLALWVLLGSFLLLPIWIRMLLTGNTEVLPSLIMTVSGLIGLITVYSAVNKVYVKRQDIANDRKLLIGFCIGLLGLATPLVQVIVGMLQFIGLGSFSVNQLWALGIYCLPILLSIQIGYGLGLYKFKRS